MFGIQLSDYVDAGSQAPALTIVGDLRPVDVDSSIPGDQFSHDDLGNLLVISNSLEANRADLLHGSQRDDVIIGRGGSDRLFGKAGHDSLFGDQQSTIEQAFAGSMEPGNGLRGDWLDGGDGDDLLVGSSDRDVLLGGDGADTLIGGAGDDNLAGDDVTAALAENWDSGRIEVPLGNGIVSVRATYSNASSVSPVVGGNDVLYGQGGQDYLTGGWGDDLLDGGTEDDVLAGEGGNDTLRGGDDNDVLLGDNLDWSGGLRSKHHGNDFLDGGNGNDMLGGNGGSDVLFGGAGNDDLTGDDALLQGVDGDAADYFGNDFLDGGAGDDTLQGGGADDTLYGGSGNDVLSGDYGEHPIRYQGNDYLDGGDGDDTLRGMGGCDTLMGGDGADVLDGDVHGLEPGGVNDDYIHGGAGNDSIWGGLGADTLYGGVGDDILVGDYADDSESGHGADYLNGGSGNDTLFGGAGNDTLIGGSGVDNLIGGAGDNVFEGGPGNDYLEGQDGDDSYHFGIGDGLDVIVDEGGKNIIKFGLGFSAAELKADIIVIEIGPVLRLSNGLGDAILIRDFEKWKASLLSFMDGSVLSFRDVMKLIEGPEISDSQSVVKEADGDSLEADAKDAAGLSEEGAISQTTLWDEKFITQAHERRNELARASGAVLNSEGDWFFINISDDKYSYSEQLNIAAESFQAGELTETPSWMKSDVGHAVMTARSSDSTAHNESKRIVGGGGKVLLSKEPRYYRSGTNYSGFALSPGDVLVEDKSELGVIRGWYVYPAGSLESGETFQKDYHWSTVVETIRHQIVQGTDTGGRVNLETGNIFHGGAGNDLVVTYTNPTIRYGNPEDRVPGALLSGGAGNDTLLGSEGADYLISGAGTDHLYGENGPDTYVVGEHAGATTIIADILTPIFNRNETGSNGWQIDPLGRSDQDTVVFPKGVSHQKLELNWGTALIEVINVELEPSPNRGDSHIAPRGKMLCTTLDISWGSDQTVRIVMPNSSNPAGSGIEVIKFSDGTSISLEALIGNSELGAPPDTYNHGLMITNAEQISSFRSNKSLPLVGSRGNDTLSGAGEIRGMQGDDLISGEGGDDVLVGGAGDDTLSGGAGNDIYKYDGLGKDVVVNSGGGNDGIDFSGLDVSIGQLNFHRDNDDLVIVVNYGISPKIRVINHFMGGDSAIGFIRVLEPDRTAKDYSVSQVEELLHPMPPPEDIDEIVALGGDEASDAVMKMIKFYGLDG